MKKIQKSCIVYNNRDIDIKYHWHFTILLYISPYLYISLYLSNFEETKMNIIINK